MDPTIVPPHYHPPLLIANGGALVIIALVLGIVLRNLLQYIKGWDERKENLLSIFESLCHERQEACGDHMKTRIEAVAIEVGTKIAGLETQTKSACKKIDEIRKSRHEKWMDQEKLNRELLLKNNNRRGNNG